MLKAVGCHGNHAAKNPCTRPNLSTRTVWYNYIMLWSAVVLGINSMSNGGSNFHEVENSEQLLDLFTLVPMKEKLFGGV